MEVIIFILAIICIAESFIISVLKDELLDKISEIKYLEEKYEKYKHG